MYMCVCIYSLYRKRFIIRNLLTQLWRLRRPKTCRMGSNLESQEGQWHGSNPSWKAWEPEELMVKFQPKGWQASGPGGVDVSVRVERQEKFISQLKSVRQMKMSLNLGWVSLCSIQVFNWLNEAHIGEMVCFTQSTYITLISSKTASQKHPV